MAKNKNKKSEQKFSGGISTKSYKPQAPRASEVKDEQPEKKNVFKRFFAWIASLPKKAKAIIAISLCVAVLCGATIPLVVYIVRTSRENNFSYLNSDLSDYLDFAEEYYTDFPLVIDIAKPHEKNADGTGVSDVEIVILSMLAKDKGGKTIGGMVTDSDAAASENGLIITPGDDVYFWYRGYVIRDGKEVDVTSLSNFYKDEASIRLESNAYTIGEGLFAVAGIEGGMVGKNIKDYATFKKITAGQVKAGQVIYISCERVPVGGTEANRETGNAVRIDLADEETASIWLPIFEGATIGHEVDDFRVTVDGVEYDYSKAKVEFVTECENGENKPTLTIEGYAPYDFSIAQLRNETVYIDVYVSGVQKRNEWHVKGLTSYELSYDWTDEYVQSKLDEKDAVIKAEELAEYEGETLTEKYENYIKKYIDDNYKENLKQMAEDAMWQYLLARAEVIKYPEKMVQKIFDEYRNDLTSSYATSGGIIKDYYTGENVTCETLDEYAIQYYQLQYSENQDWQQYLTKLAESLVKERLVMYYLVNTLDLCTDAEFVIRFGEVKDSYVEEYIKQDSTDTSKYTEEEYEEYVEEVKKKIFDTYDDEYFTEATYFEIVMEKMLPRAKVHTLDDVTAKDRWIFDFVSGWV